MGGRAQPWLIIVLLINNSRKSSSWRYPGLPKRRLRCHEVDRLSYFPVHVNACAGSAFCVPVALALSLLSPRGRGGTAGLNMWVSH